MVATVKADRFSVPSSFSVYAEGLGDAFMSKTVGISKLKFVNQLQS